MTTLISFNHGHVASINSITFLLPESTISLLLHSSTRYFSYLIACMATVHSLRTGQRLLLPTVNREGRNSDPSRSAWQKADEPAETSTEVPRSLWQRRMLAERPWDRVKDPDSVTALMTEPRCVKGTSSSPTVMVKSDHEGPGKSFSHLGEKPYTSYPQEFHPIEVAKSEKVLLDRHVATRSTPLCGVYAPRYNTNSKAETDRTNHHEM